MVKPEVGARVKRVRRGCRPNYGTVEKVLSYGDWDRAHWLLIRWDHGPVSRAVDTELQPVVREPRR